MARDYSIHVVLDPHEIGAQAVKAAFTVKHELDAWLRQYAGRESYEVARVRDGGR